MSYFDELWRILMRIIEPSYEIVPVDLDALELIERVARTCYKTEDLIKEDSAEKFVRMLMNRGHHAMLEFARIIVRFICDRGVSHELVRHRLCSFAQESTRFCNYSKNKFGGEITVIRPCFWTEGSAQYKIWEYAMRDAEFAYMALLETGAKAEEARAVLPNSLATEIVVSANLREWKHIFKLRTSEFAHPQIRQSLIKLMYECWSELPVIFEDEVVAYESQKKL